MNRKDLTEIITFWRLGLISEMEYRLALAYAVRGGTNCIEEAIARVQWMKESGIIG